MKQEVVEEGECRLRDNNMGEVWQGVVECVDGCAGWRWDGVAGCLWKKNRDGLWEEKRRKQEAERNCYV